MALELTLTEKVSGTLWSAAGTFSGTEGKETKRMPAKVFIRQDQEEFRLHADAELNNGTIGSYNVIAYEAHLPIVIPDARPGTRLNFKEIFITVKN